MEERFWQRLVTVFKSLRNRKEADFHVFSFQNLSVLRITST
jgi:hypothetical protein